MGAGVRGGVTGLLQIFMLCCVALTTFVLPGAVLRNEWHRRSHCASAHNGSQQGF